MEWKERERVETWTRKGKKRYSLTSEEQTKQKTIGEAEGEHVLWKGPLLYTLKVLCVSPASALYTLCDLISYLIFQSLGFLIC